jgi:hypothetical protein
MQKTLRYLAAATALGALAFLTNCAVSGTAESRDGPRSISQNAVPQSSLIEDILSYRDFFIRFEGYEGNFLCDINGELGANRVGLLLLEPSGFLKSLVFKYDGLALTKIHENVTVPPKALRAELTRGGILVSDARLLARNIAGLRMEKNDRRSPRNRRKGGNGTTPRREAMPQELPAGYGPEKPPRKDTDKMLTRLRGEVAQNPELTAMESTEILKRFRAELETRALQERGQERKEVHR